MTQWTQPLYELRLGVTDVDQLRWYEASEDMTLDELIERFRRPDVQTEAMRRGTAFHRALERLTAGDTALEVDQVEEDGYTFDFGGVDATLPDLPVRESYIGGRYRLPSGILVRLYGKIDAGLGGLVGDYKLSARAPDVDHYARAYQWRLYLWLSGASEFRYWAFQYRSRKNDPEDYIPIAGMHELPFYAYPGMHDDCIRELERFGRFAARHVPDKWGEPQDPRAYIPTHYMRATA